MQDSPLGENGIHRSLCMNYADLLSFTYLNYITFTKQHLKIQKN